MGLSTWSLQPTVSGPSDETRSGGKNKAFGVGRPWFTLFLLILSHWRDCWISLSWEVTETGAGAS